jgi:GTP cyclohydrolase I
MTVDLKLERDVRAFARGEDAVVELIRLVGEDPSRDGLLRTPGRVVKALREMTAGYDEDPAGILATTFEENSDELILLRGIEFYSICEHHLLPFHGTASVGYLPGEVVGISKLARLVNCFARRLQIQERLTRQIATAIEEHLHARGTGVIIRAHHLCMGCRGVKLPGTELVTSSMLGTLREDAVTRAEFLRLCGDRS